MPPKTRGNLQQRWPVAAQIAAAALVLLVNAPWVARADEPLPTLTAPPPAGDPPAVAPQSLPTPPPQQTAPQQTAQTEAPADSDENNVHGMGLALSFSSGAGFAYRRQWGATSLQLAAFGIVTDRGNSTLVSGGALVAQRLHVWHGASRSILPATSALRVVGGLSYFLNRGVTNQFVNNGDSAGGVQCVTIGGCSATITSNSSYFNGGLGLGFEFGAINRPGVSMTLDVVLTAALRDGAFSFLLPLPQLAVLYNW